jgi:hypothetical protein
MHNIDQHIKIDKEELNNPTISPQRRRHLEDELEALQIYKANHPNSEYDPTPLELYCELNPNAPECRIYEN